MAARGRGDEQELWWVPTVVPLGLGAWATFLYLGVRTGRTRWIVQGFAYLAVIVFAAAVNLGVDEPDLTLALVAAASWYVTWATGMLHARLIRHEARERLAEARRIGSARRGVDHTKAAQELAAREPDVAERLGLERYGLIDVNAADAATLATLPGVDAALAARIVAVREQVGPLKSLAELGLVLDLPGDLVERLRPRTVFLQL